MITSITLKNFRGLKDKTLKFYPGTNILRGRNEIGKTTINEAISFGFYGCDQYGNRSPDHLISHGEEYCEVVINTGKATFHRNKVRGATPTIQFTRAGVPSIKMNQTELTQLLGLSFELFASLYNVGFFMDLPDAKKKEVIGQIAKLDRKAILEAMLPGVEIPTYIKLDNLKLSVQTVATQRRTAQNQLSSDQGALGQIIHQVNEFQNEVNGVLDLKAEIEKLTAQADLFDLYQSDLAKYQWALARAKELREENKRILSESNRLELELTAMGKLKAPDEAAVAEVLNNLESKISTAKNMMEIPPPVPAFLDLPKDSCPRCGQLIPDKLRESSELEREKALSQYNKLAREVENRNAALQLQIESWTKEHSAQSEKFNNEKTEAAARSAKKEEIEKRLTSTPFKDVHDPAVPRKPEGDEKEVRTKLADLNAKFHAQQLFQQKRDQLIAREKTYRMTVESNSKLLGHLKRLEEALLQIPEKEVKQTLEMLKTPGVVLSFMDDELRVTDEKGVPYQSLSTGRKMKMSLSLCKTFQRLVSRAPQFYFIDNVDLMDEYRSLLPDAQVFIAKVDESVQELQVVQI